MAGVDKVCSDESESDGAYQVHGLHTAPDSEIEEERQHSPSQGFRIGNCESDNVRRDSHGAKHGFEEPNWGHQDGRKSQAEIDAI
jgi:hypothetical protein